MDSSQNILEILRNYGIGRRKIDDELFKKDDKITRIGVYDVDDEELCHNVVEIKCNVPGCLFKSETLLEYETHYNGTHRYSCSQCKKIMPSPHLLELHVEESHDSYFAVMSERKPSYSCFIKECQEKFLNPDERRNHCISTHKLPKDFRFVQRRKQKVKKDNENSMDVDIPGTSKLLNKFAFKNSKKKGFVKYTGKKFTQDNKKNTEIKMDISLSEIKESLPD